MVYNYKNSKYKHCTASDAFDFAYFHTFMHFPKIMILWRKQHFAKKKRRKLILKLIGNSKLRIFDPILSENEHDVGRKTNIWRKVRFKIEIRA